MKTFIVYEVWTVAKQIKAKSARDAYQKADPKPRKGMSLCNWHAIEVKK